MDVVPHTDESATRASVLSCLVVAVFLRQRALNGVALGIEKPSQGLIILIAKIGAHAHVPGDGARNSR